MHRVRRRGSARLIPPPLPEPMLSTPEAAPEPATDLAAPAPLPFVSISPRKLLVLTLCTFGVYEVWWLFRQWRQVREATGEDVSPPWRAVFGILFCYSLFKRVEKQSLLHRLPGGTGPDALAAAYIVPSLLYRLPDPYWLVAFLGVLPLLAVQGSINRLNEHLRPGTAVDARLGAGGRTLAVLGCLVWLLVALAMVGPAAAVQRGSEMRDRDRAVLVSEGYVERGEDVLFFYSAGFLSVRSDGNVLTDRRVVSYALEGGERYHEAVAYEDIYGVEAEFGAAWTESTRVLVTTRRGDEVWLVLATEGGMDRAFVERLKHEWRLRVPAGTERMESSPSVPANPAFPAG